MPHRIGMAVVCLHISAVIYFLLGLLMLSLPLFSSDERSGLAGAFAIGLFVLCLVLVGGIEFVVYGLKQRKFWAWVAGLCIFGLYAPSLFLPLGALGLWGLLDAGSQAEFGIGGTSKPGATKP